jgi:hypothetical protein
VDSTLTNEIRNSRDWALRLLVRRQRLRLALRKSTNDTRRQRPRAGGPGGVTQPHSLALLAAVAEELCAPAAGAGRTEPGADPGLAA